MQCRETGLSVSDRVLINEERCWVYCNIIQEPVLVVSLLQKVSDGNQFLIFSLISAFLAFWKIASAAN